MKSYSRQRLAEAAVKLLEKYPVKDVAAVLAQELAAQRRLGDVEQVLNDVGRSLLARGQLTAEVTSARPLSKAVIMNLTRFLKQYTHATEVQVVTRLDPRLIGGAVVRTPNMEIDMSIKQKLNELYTYV
jgi:F0F1-type ATP synthase delta subunit